MVWGCYTSASTCHTTGLHDTTLLQNLPNGPFVYIFKNPQKPAGDTKTSKPENLRKKYSLPPSSNLLLPTLWKLKMLSLVEYLTRKPACDSPSIHFALCYYDSLPNKTPIKTFITASNSATPL